MLSEIGAQLGINHSFFIEFAIIAGLYFILSPFYFRPYQSLFEKRERETIGAQKEAQSLEASAAEKLALYKDRIKSVNAQVRQVLKDSESQAQGDSAAILNEATSAARTKVQTIQKELQSQKEEVIQRLAQESSDLAKDIVAKVLGSSISIR